MLISRSGLATALLAALVAGCSVNPTALTTLTPTDTPSAETTSPALATAVPSPAVPTVSPQPSPAGLGGFITAVPPGAETPWSGINWRKLASDDPLAHFRSVLRWRDGFVALGAVIATGAMSRTPVWVSTDGGAWRPLDANVFGPATIVVGVGETAVGIVALTLQGGANQCDGQATPLNCWTLAAPLQAWTSSDATNWTSHPGPSDMALSGVGCAGCGVDVPVFRSGTPGLLVINHSGGTAWIGARAAFSRDGVTWEVLPAAAFPAGFAFGDVAGSGSGFISVGATGPDRIRALALSSADGRHWASNPLPTSGLDPYAAPTANSIVVGPGGLIVTGSDGLAPGTELWWASVSGGTWSRLSGYPPLGVWTGQGAGSGLAPNGTLLGDGERMLAYRGGDKPAAWTSSDGRSWQTLAIGGAWPTGTGGPILLPIGILWIGDDGSSWFGQPVP